MNNANPHRKSKFSAAHIVIRPAAAEPKGLPTQPPKCGSESGNHDRFTTKPSPSPAANGAFIAGLRKLMADSGTNKNELAVNVISACLDVGIEKGPEIRRITTILGFDPVHIRCQLKYGVRAKKWARTQEGLYSILAKVA